MLWYFVPTTAVLEDIMAYQFVSEKKFVYHFGSCILCCETVVFRCENECQYVWYVNRPSREHWGRSKAAGRDLDGFRDFWRGHSQYYTSLWPGTFDCTALQ